MPKERLTSEQVQALQRGKKQAFWQIICDELRYRVGKLTDEVMDERVSDEDEKRKKFKASVYRSLIDFPDTLIRENEELPQEDKKADPSQAY